MEPPTSPERAWARQWAAAGPALARVRAEALRAMTPAQALAAADALLALGAGLELPDRRRSWSGLVEMQQWLARAS